MDFDANFSTHLLDDALADREAEAGAAIAAVDRGIDLQEFAEQAPDPVRRNADAGVGDGHFDSSPHRPPTETPGGNFDVTRR